MSPEAQRIAIAEACGWNGIKHADYTNCALSKFFGISPKYGTYQPVPDHLNDLNAMHEAEKVMTRNQRVNFVSKLCGIVGVKWKATSHFDSIHATAAQRAEAFLRTIGKWEGQP
jgi:hypothetical protein